MSGLCLKLHYCTPGLVRTSTGSTPYKGTTSPIPIIIIIIVVVVVVVGVVVVDNQIQFYKKLLYICRYNLHLFTIILNIFSLLNYFFF